MLTQQTGLSNIQKELLKLYANNISDQQLFEIKLLLSQYFADRATEAMDKFLDEHDINEDTLVKWSGNITGMRVVIDTNILVSIISKRSPFRWIFDCIILGKIQLCVSTEILLEYKEILQFKTDHLVSDNILDFISVSPFVEKTDIFYRFNLIEKDSTDNKFVDCAISADVVCIISNDKHFQVLKTIIFPNVKVFTLDGFATRYKFELA